MLFNSVEFLFVFLPVVLVGFYLIGNYWGKAFALGWLFFSSLIYYGSWEPAYLWLLFASLSFNYFSAWLLEKSQGLKKAVLTVSVAGNVLTLFYYKALIAGYLGSAGEVVNSFSTTKDVIIPLAISFITFQQIAFLVDTYKSGFRKADPLEYCLFISFFPQLVMGPIVHYREIVPQFRLSTLFALRWDNIALGVSIFIVGLFKKVVLADGISPYVNEVYSAVLIGQQISPADAFGAAIGFVLQLYFDFSGYADMAVGLARMFNINLPINFDSPFRSVNRFDFWRRWHISFGAFMRQYVFFPLARSRKIKLGSLGALVLTVFVSSIWHGVGPTFFVWGGLQGVMMIVVHYREKLPGYVSWRRRFKPFSTWGSIALTFCTTVILGVFFRASDLDVAFSVIDYLRQGILLLFMGDFPTFAYDCLIEKSEVNWIIAMAIVVWGLPNTQKLFSSYWTAIDQRVGALSKTAPDLMPGASKLRFSPSRIWALVFGLMLFVILACTDSSVRFVYYQF
jgi:D-alanyl-lipoteichoic acid acyltransferase DltB (MBOAT superfamily)